MTPGRALPLLLAAACGGHSDPMTTLDASADPDATAADADPVPSCSALEVLFPRTVDEVKATLRSSRTFPFPGGWASCAGPNVCTEDAAPVLSFNTTFTLAQCGQNYESGFHDAASYPMTIVERDPGVYQIEIELPTGATRFEVAALGSLAAPQGLRLLDAQQRFSYYRPLDHLP